jgi:phosphohistidine phosphatase
MALQLAEPDLEWGVDLGTMLGAMRVYLCRHAQAAPGEPDDLRELTPKGVEQARVLAKRLAALPEPPAAVLSSPLVRARQTAEAIAAALGMTNEPRDELVPGATIASLRSALKGRHGPVAVVGHQPDCSEIALALTGRDPGFHPGDTAAMDLGLDA